VNKARKPAGAKRAGSPKSKVGGGARGRGGTAAAPRDTRGGTRRQGLGGDQVEGRQAVRELLLAGRRKVREVWLLAGSERSAILEDIVELAEGQRVPTREVGRSKFLAEARCEAPQGVLAKAAPLPAVSLDDLAMARPGGRPPFLVAVDGVTDPGNLGAVLRAAECAGATGVVLPRHRAVHVTPTVTKAAAGAVEHLGFAVVGGLPSALQELRKHGVWVVGLDARGGRADRARARRRGHWSVALGPAALRRRGEHPAGRVASVAQRGGCRRAGLLRGRPGSVRAALNQLDRERGD
jgi:23S rRNA (guanosine2251-2'-O)-methyltransferase